MEILVIILVASLASVSLPMPEERGKWSWGPSHGSSYPSHGSSYPSHGSSYPSYPSYPSYCRTHHKPSGGGGGGCMPTFCRSGDEDSSVRGEDDRFHHHKPSPCAPGYCRTFHKPQSCQPTFYPRPPRPPPQHYPQYPEYPHYPPPPPPPPHRPTGHERCKCVSHYDCRPPAYETERCYRGIVCCSRGGGGGGFFGSFPWWKSGEQPRSTDSD